MTNAAQDARMWAKSMEDVLKSQSQQPAVLSHDALRLLIADLRRLADERDAMLEACKVSRRAFAELNGRVSFEVWNGLYETVSAVDAAIKKAEGEGT